MAVQGQITDWLWANGFMDAARALARGVPDPRAAWAAMQSYRWPKKKSATVVPIKQGRQYRSPLVAMAERQKQKKVAR